MAEDYIGGEVNEGGNIRHRGASSPISTTFGEYVGNFIPINEGVTCYIPNERQQWSIRAHKVSREDLRVATVSRFDLALSSDIFTNLLINLIYQRTL